MATKQPERRRFEEKERKPWTEEQRSSYNKAKERLAPLVRDITTPAKKEKEKDWLESLLEL
jgi:hypothetical protein